MTVPTANTSPIYVAEPLSVPLKLTTGANTYTGADATQIFVAGQDGARIERLRAMPVGVTLNSKLLVYIKSSGVFALLQDWPLNGVTPAATATGGNVDIAINLSISGGDEVWVQLTVASPWDLTLFAGNF